MTDERIQNSQIDEPLQFNITSQIAPSYYFYHHLGQKQIKFMIASFLIK